MGMWIVRNKVSLGTTSTRNELRYITISEALGKTEPEEEESKDD